MKKNKVITILLLSLLASIAAGCGAQSQSVSEAAESVSAPQPSAEAVEPVETDTSVETPESLGSAADSVDEPPLAEVEYPLTDTTETLSVFFSVSPMLAEMISSMNDIAAYDKAEQETNVHLDAVLSTPETTSEKFQVMIASGTYTDLMHGVSLNYAGGYDKAIDDEVLLDLNPYLDEYAPNYVAFLNENETAKRLYTTEAGRMGAIQGLSYSFVQGPVMRQDWLDDCGLEVPRTEGREEFGPFYHG